MTINIHHRRALVTLVITVVLDLILGFAYGHYMGIGAWHGIYCATGTATTVGCDIVPRGQAAYIISFVMFITVVPLFASVFSFFITGLTTDHVEQHVEKHVSRLVSSSGNGRDSV